MQLTKADVVSIIGVIQANYTCAYKDATEQTMEVLIDTWFGSLKRYPKEVVLQALRLSLESSKLPPTLADMISQIKNMQKAVGPSLSELWDILFKAIARTQKLTHMFSFTFIEDNGLTQGQNARIKVEQIFNDMPAIIKSYLSSVSTLISLSQLDNDKLSYEKTRFFSYIPQLQNNISIQTSISIDRSLILASMNIEETSNSYEVLPNIQLLRE